MKENENMELKAIYEGELISCWDDGEGIILSFPQCSVNFSDQDFYLIAQELSLLVQALNNKNHQINTEFNTN